jgi:hypothetical protein
MLKPGQKVSLFGGAITIRRKEKFDRKAYWQSFAIIFALELIYICATTDWSKIFHGN